MTKNRLRLDKDNVPLRTGPPTPEEMQVYYPPQFTWPQLKIFVNSGDLGLLKRERQLQKRYFVWADVIMEQYGSMVNYLTNHRLRWGQPDTISSFPSAIDEEAFANAVKLATEGRTPPLYFSWETPAECYSIIQNDWPYSVPPEIEHTLIWTKAPIYHRDLVDESIQPRIDQDGLWGFSGNDSPPPSPSLLPSCISVLAKWGMRMDSMIKSDPPNQEEATLLQKAGREVDRFVKNRWIESDWETAWFVNPPRLQSVPDLAHIHVFARKKAH